jgi:hypothetical protein
MLCQLSRTMLGTLVLSSLLVVVGCTGRPSRISPPKVKPAQAAADAMAMYDTNKDGKISGDEFAQCTSLKAIAQNGEVTQDRIAAVVAGWQQSRIGRLSISVCLRHNNSPLGNATVKLVPEKFMGTDILTITAKTDAANGAIALSVPTKGPEEPQGVSPGFYRLEVTKDGDNIPAKYNTETTLCIAAIEEGRDFSFTLAY